MNQVLGLDLCVGVSGGSLETDETLEALKECPLDRLILGTDSPFSLITQEFAGWKYLTHYKPLFEIVKILFIFDIL